MKMLKRNWRPRRATVGLFPPTAVVARRYQPGGAWGVTLRWSASTRDQAVALRETIFDPLALDLRAEIPALYSLQASTATGVVNLWRVSDEVARGKSYSVTAEFHGVGPLQPRTHR